MPFRLARTLRSLCAAARAADRRSRSVRRCAAEPLESRTLLDATTGPNFIAPYLHDSEWQKTALVAQYTADARPVSSRVTWGDGTSEALMLDYETTAENVGTAYGYHEYAAPGPYIVTFSLTGADGWVSSQSFVATAVVLSDSPMAPTSGESLTTTSQSSSSSTAPAVTGVFVGGTAWTGAFKSYMQSIGLGDATYGFAVPAGDQLNELSWSNLDEVSVCSARTWLWARTTYGSPA